MASEGSSASPPDITSPASSPRWRAAKALAATRALIPRKISGGQRHLFRPCAGSGGVGSSSTSLREGEVNGQQVEPIVRAEQPRLARSSLSDKRFLGFAD